MKKFLKYFSIIYLLLITVIALGNDVIEIEIEIKDHKFEPDIIEVPRNQKIRLTVYNEDSTIEEFDSIDLKREKIIPGKSFVHIILAPLKPGKYYFIGEFHQGTAKGCIIVN